MVVIVIIVVLAAISFPIMARVKSAARATECVSNLRQLGGAILSHAIDNHGKLVDLQPAVDPDPPVLLPPDGMLRGRVTECWRR